MKIDYIHIKPHPRYNGDNAPYGKVCFAKNEEEDAVTINDFNLKDTTLVRVLALIEEDVHEQYKAKLAAAVGQQLEPFKMPATLTTDEDTPPTIDV